MDLHPIESKVIKGLKTLGGKGSASEVAEAGGIEKIQAERFGYSLSEKGFVKLNKDVSDSLKLTKLGEKYLKKGLPERQILDALKTGLKSSKELAEELNIDENAIAACIGIFKKNAWAEVRKGDKGLVFEISELGKGLLEKGEFGSLASLSSLEPSQADELRRRGIVEKDEKTTYILEILKEPKVGGSKSIENITPEILKNKSWKGRKIRGYDINAQTQPYFGGALHPHTLATEKIRRTFLELGFEEMGGNYVESTFWNFDALFQPQDHPSRDLADTFYLKKPEKSKLPDKKYVDSVKRAHEEGTKGSTGWQYDWKRSLAEKPVLRTHTTAVSARWLTKLKPPAKVFCIGRVFRNETVDYKHLPEFTQIDGIVIDENASFRDLLGYLKEFFTRLGFDKIRFRPAYFPYTEMSTEIEVYLKDKKEWIELGGSGLFRPEVTEPLGINVPVLAWGLSIERPLMMSLGLKDIRSFFYKNDLKWLREVPSV
ncbi:TPA: phenylalanine--tRNA ligase subunit alpha [archaeon]|nr:phenylalanine--tRNA ligase subunit alpha [Candidatus Undinarchaeales archaeon SRR5007147.bin71]